MCENCLSLKMFIFVVFIYAFFCDFLFVYICNRYSEENARKLMIQVLSAVEYLHNRQIIHRDLKPENILLVSSKNDIEVKVTDFGLAKKANRDGLKTFCGTPQYFAPEVLKRKNNAQSGGRYGAAVDMWSLGVILYILLSGSFPFADDCEVGFINVFDNLCD